MVEATGVAVRRVLVVGVLVVGVLPQVSSRDGVEVPEQRGRGSGWGEICGIRILAEGRPVSLIKLVVCLEADCPFRLLAGAMQSGGGWGGGGKWVL
ncbi:hypothetical protein CYMTET_3200 [Cymbomonas tetramitiformis]|uniref:Secreted protein n=1 Tax=Cymbomonas tetramitiformis TaxID=36881 RepID=A0AAE0H3R8_9CHLO|nr:hypothetical protein CYMTET_3200 [Cymbomonas tetramitiformis]